MTQFVRLKTLPVPFTLFKVCSIRHNCYVHLSDLFSVRIDTNPFETLPRVK
jgi:hypothetical protein